MQMCIRAVCMCIFITRLVKTTIFMFEEMFGKPISQHPAPALGTSLYVVNISGNQADEYPNLAKRRLWIKCRNVVKHMHTQNIVSIRVKVIPLNHYLSV